MSSLFQSTINRQFTAGWPGEMANDGPVRAKPARIAASSVGGDVSPNAIGRVFCYSADVTAQPGIVEAMASLGGSNFFGVLINPKHHALYGASLDPLASSYALPTGSEAEFCDMGFPFVELYAPAAATNIGATFGNVLYYISGGTAAAAAGDIGRIVPATALPVLANYVFTLLPGARLINTVAGFVAGNTAVSKIQLTN